MGGAVHSALTHFLWIIRPKVKFVCLQLPTYPPKSSLPKIFSTTLESIFFFFLNGKFTMITQNSRTNRPEQRVQAQIRLLQGAVWSGSTPFAFQPAHFGYVEQSDLGLHHLPFNLHILGTWSSLIWVYTVCLSTCTFWVHHLWEK